MIYTRQNLEDLYYLDSNADSENLEDYIDKYYIPVFDDKLNFLGYEKEGG